MNSDYAGIDYGSGQTNIDPKTGIHYGVISTRNINQDSLSDLIDNSRDLNFEEYLQSVKDNLRKALEDFLSSYTKMNGELSRLDVAVNDAFEAIEDDIGDSYHGESGNFLCEKDGYVITVHADNTAVITDSPYYTFAQFCSPCVPGAGNLDVFCAAGPKTYCLGHDYFDNNIAPYPVYSVKTNKVEIPQNINFED